MLLKPVDEQRLDFWFFIFGGRACDKGKYTLHTRVEAAAGQTEFFCKDKCHAI
jgi:hypothetical protein